MLGVQEPAKELYQTGKPVAKVGRFLRGIELEDYQLTTPESETKQAEICHVVFTSIRQLTQMLAFQQDRVERVLAGVLGLRGYCLVMSQNVV